MGKKPRTDIRARTDKRTDGHAWMGPTPPPGECKMWCSDEIISYWHPDRHTHTYTRQNLYMLATQAVTSHSWTQPPIPCGTGNDYQKEAVLFSWGGNCRSCIAMAMCHRFSVISIHVQLYILGGQVSCIFTPLMSMLLFTAPDCAVTKYGSVFS